MTDIHLSNAPGYTLADLNRHTIYDGTTLSGSETFDMLTVDADDPVTVVVITGTIPAGVTIQKPTNAPPLEQCMYYLTAPGTDTWTFSGYVEHTNLPTWAAGKSVLYQWKRVPVDGTPANDHYLLSGNIQGGSTFTPTALPDIPAVGVETAYRTHPTWGQTYLRYWTGVISGTVTSLGPAVTGTMNHLVDKGGDMTPLGANSNQGWGMPYVAGSMLLSADIQLHDNALRIICGQQVADETPTYYVWAEYTKV